MGRGMNPMMASIAGEEFDKEEFAEVMKKIFAAQAAAKAAGEDVTPGQAKRGMGQAAARERSTSAAPKRAVSNTPKARAKSPKKAAPKTKAATIAATAKPRALTPSGKSSWE